MTEEARVQHLGVRDQDARRFLAQNASLVGRCVAVVPPRIDGAPRDLSGEGCQLIPLIEGERLVRVDHESVRSPLRGQRVKHRNLEGKCLAAGCWGLQDDVTARQCTRDRVCLMLVESVDAPSTQCSGELGWQRIEYVRVSIRRGDGRQRCLRNDIAALLAVAQGIELA